MNKEGSKIKKNWFITIGIILLTIAAILLFYFFSHGETKINGTWTIEKTGSLTCDAFGISYPFFEYDNSDKKIVKVNLSVNGESIKNISLIYIMEYADEKSTIDSENINHIAMNESFSENNLEFDALELKFSRFSNGLQMNLFANSSEINTSSAKYFMLEKISDNIALTKIQETYEAQGFICEKKN